MNKENGKENETNRDGVEFEELLRKLYREFEWYRRMPDSHVFRFSEDAPQREFSEELIRNIVKMTAQELNRELSDYLQSIRTVIRPDKLMQVCIKMFAFGIAVGVALVEITRVISILSQMQ